MSEIMKQSPEAGGTKLNISKQACHQIAGLATSILLATGLQGCGKSHAETPVDTDTSAPIIMADASGDPAYEKALNGTIDLDGNSSGAVVKVDSDGEVTIKTAQVQAMKPTSANYAVPNTGEELKELDIPTQIENIEKQIAELGNGDIRERIALRKQLAALERAESIAEKAETTQVEKRVEESGKGLQEADAGTKIAETLAGINN